MWGFSCATSINNGSFAVKSPSIILKKMPYSVAWINFFCWLWFGHWRSSCLSSGSGSVSFRCCWTVGNCSSGCTGRSRMTNLWSLSLFVHLSSSRYIRLPTKVPSLGKSALSVFIYIMTGPSGLCSCMAVPIVTFVRISEWDSVWTFLFLGYIHAEFPAYRIVNCSRWCTWN